MPGMIDCLYQDAEKKSRKFLKDILGDKLFNKFVEDGKIEVESGNTTYELYDDGRIINKTTNQKYCIVPDRSDYPNYDVIAIKYGWLKYGQRTVERVANRTSLRTSLRPFDIVGPAGIQRGDDTVGYDAFVHYMESNGWRREQLTLNENHTNIVSTYGVDIGSTGDVVDIRCPAGMTMTMIGVSQLPSEADGRSAHSLALRIANKDDLEINGDIQIIIQKVKPSDAVITLARGPYSIFSLKRRIGNGEHNIWADKTDNGLYRWRMGIHLLGEELLRIAVINTDVIIPSDRVKVMMDADIWTRMM